MDKKRDWFEWWLTINPDRIYELFDSLPTELVEKLDYSVVSLLVFEEYLIVNYTYEDIIKEENREMLDNLSRYVGEVARRNLKEAKWDLYLKDKKNIYYNVPIISAPNIFGGMFCPLYSLTTAINRRKGDFLYKEIQSIINRQKN